MNSSEYEVSTIRFLVIERQNEHRTSQHKTVKGRAASCFDSNPTLTPSDNIGGEMCGTSKVFAVSPRPLGARLPQAAARRRLAFGFICGVANQDPSGRRHLKVKGNPGARHICLGSGRTVALRVAGVRTQTRTGRGRQWTRMYRGRGRAVDADAARTRTPADTDVARTRTRRIASGRGRARTRTCQGRGRHSNADFLSATIVSDLAMAAADTDDAADKNFVEDGGGVDDKGSGDVEDKEEGDELLRIDSKQEWGDAKASSTAHMKNTGPSTALDVVGA